MGLRLLFSQVRVEGSEDRMMSSGFRKRELIGDFDREI